MSELAPGTFQLVSSKGYSGCHQSECTLQTDLPALKVESPDCDINNKQESWDRAGKSQSRGCAGFDFPKLFWNWSDSAVFVLSTKNLQMWGIAAGANAECSTTGKGGHAFLGSAAVWSNRMFSPVLCQVQQLQRFSQQFSNLIWRGRRGEDLCVIQVCV